MSPRMLINVIPSAYYIFFGGTRFRGVLAAIPNLK
jgi:hypothetical protein